MSRLKASAAVFISVVLVFLVLNIVAFSILVILAPDDLTVQYIPDDAFYYLTLSRHFSSLGYWTFDSGISVTSGFHPLLAYALATIFSVLRLDADSYVTVGVLLSLLFTLGSIFVVWYWGLRSGNTLLLVYLSLVISSGNFVYNAVSITEWSLTVFFAALYGLWFFNKYEKPKKQLSDYLVLFTLGILGSCARSDFGLFPFAIFVASMILLLVNRHSRRHFPLAVLGLLGTLSGLVVVLTQNYVFTQELLQSSARMKALWAEWIRPNYYAVPTLIGRFVGVAGLLLMAIFVALAVLPRIIDQRRQRSSRESGFTADPMSDDAPSMTPYGFSTEDGQRLIHLTVSATICILGYALFYSRNASIQPWYSANLIVPMLLFIAGLSYYIDAYLSKKVKKALYVLFIPVIAFNVLDHYPVSTFNAPWPHQRLMREAGIFLSENQLDGRVGAWNAGLIGYYEGGNVVNLDGLVNNDIYDYAASNSLPAYISSRDIKYIIDFENMVTDRLRLVRGGYDDASFLASLKPAKVFDNGEYIWRFLTLYSVNEVDVRE
jgi:hypothetical protein